MRLQIKSTISSIYVQDYEENTMTWPPYKYYYKVTNSSTYIHDYEANTIA